MPYIVGHIGTAYNWKHFHISPAQIPDFSPNATG